MERPRQHDRQPFSRAGFSIVEILIAVMIIGVLAVILIPTLVNRVKEAKIAAAERDLEEIAEAQRRAAIQMNYYLRMYALDDIPGGDGYALGDANDQRDGIADEIANTVFYDTPSRLFINPNTNDLLDTARADAVYASLAPETAYIWQGPYLTIQRDESPALHDRTSNPPHLHDIPTDPWGNDYLMFFRTGLLREPEGDIVTQVTWYTDTWDTEVFDRPTVLSVGPDGLPGDGQPGSQFGEGDDIVRPFEF
ncbi:prepilin-type N-terminal cleavage/methylation domain-containing protein [bacterium]|nr:prepilin-type N-terminal cleavage/methylation domain-containing protein [bacterium]